MKPLALLALAALLPPSSARADDVDKAGKVVAEAVKKRQQDKAATASELFLAGRKAFKDKDYSGAESSYSSAFGLWGRGGDFPQNPAGYAMGMHHVVHHLNNLAEARLKLSRDDAARADYADAQAFLDLMRACGIGQTSPPDPKVLGACKLASIQEGRCGNKEVTGLDERRACAWWNLGNQVGLDAEAARTSSGLEKLAKRKKD